MHAHKTTDATNTGHAIWAHGEGNARCAATAAANAVLAATWYGVHELLLAPHRQQLRICSHLVLPLQIHFRWRIAPKQLSIQGQLSVSGGHQRARKLIGASAGVGCACVCVLAGLAKTPAGATRRGCRPLLASG